MAMYRGLSTFISDIRACKTKEQEQQRVDKELANVRMAFTSGRMSEYDRKKYVWKLVYINMLGYDVDFGHMEMISLLSATTYAEKLVGYLATSVMLKNTDSQITLVVQAIKNDLQSTQDPVQCLALSGIANIGGKELAEAVAGDVTNILFSRSIFPVVRKKAALCLLRMARVNRDILPAAEWRQKLVTLLEDKHLGVVLSVVTLLQGLAERGNDAAHYENCTGHLLVWLTRLAVKPGETVSEEYMYHGVACPWLQVKLLRLLQCFPIPAMPAMRARLDELLLHILNKTEVTKSVNRNNAEHCVLFEAVNLIIKQGDASQPELRVKAVAHLAKFINIREPNIRYLGLETMARISSMEGTKEPIRKQQATIFFSLKDADISIRRRALDLLFVMCDRDIAESVVKELLNNLAAADWQIKDELVLKTAILAERYAPNLQWYVDTILALVDIAGDHVSDDIWHRVVQIVTNNEDLQKYAASKMYHGLEPLTAHPTAVKVGAYVLGEFGFYLNDGDIDGGAPIAGVQLFAALHQHFTRCDTAGKCILLSTYAKFQHLYPELRATIVPIFELLTSALDSELQQRAVEYLHLPELREEVALVVLETMPAFPERDSILEAKLKKAQAETHDKDVWNKEERVEAGGEEGEEEGGDGAGAGARRGSKGSVNSAGVPSSSAAAPPTAPGGGLDDLLGLGGAPEPAPAPAAVDPLTVPVTVRKGLDPAQADQIARWLSNVLTKPASVLYEDSAVQIGVKKAAVGFGGAEGTLTLFIGNKAPVPLVGFKLRVPELPAVKVTVGEVPSTLAVKQQVQVPVTVECMSPFVDPPALQLSFISVPGTGHAYPLKLPVAVCSFSEQYALAAADFKTRWGALAGAPKEATAMVAPASGAGAVTLEAANKALEVINMSNIATGAPGATGASSFRTHTMTASGQHVSVGCLAMVIPDAAGAQFKVAVRTQHPDVSKALIAVLQNYLSHL